MNVMRILVVNDREIADINDPPDELVQHFAFWLSKHSPTSFLREDIAKLEKERLKYKLDDAATIIRYSHFMSWHIQWTKWKTRNRDLTKRTVKRFATFQKNKLCLFCVFCTIGSGLRKSLLSSWCIGHVIELRTALKNNIFIQLAPSTAFFSSPPFHIMGNKEYFYYYLLISN